jgi:hypothetical protein
VTNYSTIIAKFFDRKHLPEDTDLSHLEGNIAAVADYLRADLIHQSPSATFPIASGPTSG